MGYQQLIYGIMFDKWAYEIVVIRNEATIISIRKLSSYGTRRRLTADD